jgi:hypothetical protein
VSLLSPVQDIQIFDERILVASYSNFYHHRTGKGRAPKRKLLNLRVVHKRYPNPQVIVQAEFRFLRSQEEILVVLKDVFPVSLSRRCFQPKSGIGEKRRACVIPPLPHTVPEIREKPLICLGSDGLRHSPQYETNCETKTRIIMRHGLFAPLLSCI